MVVKTNIPYVIRELNKTEERIEQVLIETFAKVGERVTDIAKESHTYKDRTGNLTNSIGYGVVVGGKIVERGGFGGGEGGSTGEIALEKRASEVPTNSITLVVVAGMNYAEAVERRGYIVLDKARLSVESIMSNLLKQLKL